MSQRYKCHSYKCLENKMFPYVPTAHLIVYVCVSVLPCFHTCALISMLVKPKLNFFLD